jgi:hypothetical protein
MKNSLLAFTIVFIQVAAFQAGAANGEKAANFVLCKNQKAVRTIRIMPGGRGCKTTYSKAGVDEVVAENRFLAGCKESLKTIQEHLEASRWACRSVDKAEVTYSSEAATTFQR